jgi:ankyrin repeat protein
MKKTRNNKIINSMFPELSNGDYDGLIIKHKTKVYNLNDQDSWGMNCMMFAAAHNQIDLMRILIPVGIDLSAKYRNGMTALHFSCQSNCFEIARILIESGSDVNSQNIHGATPLHVSLMNCFGDLNIPKLLISNGADINRKNNYDISPFDLAKSIANYNLVQAFE